MTRVREVGVVAVLLLAATWPCTVAAIEKARTPVSMAFANCPRVSQSEAERILHLELSTIAAGRDGVTKHPTTVRVTCNALQIALEVVEQTSGKARKQLIQTDDRADGDTERLIAIAAAELVFSSWVELAANPTPPAPKKTPAKASPPDALPPETKSSSSRDPFAAFGMGVLWRIFIASRSNLFGAEITFSLRPVGPLVLRLAGALEGGRVARRLGDVSLFAVSGAFSVGLEGTLFSVLTTGAEAGIRTGYGVMNGAPDDETVEGHQVTGSFGGPMLRLTLASRTTPSIGLSMEGGYALWGLSGRVTGGHPVKMRDIWLGLVLGIEFRF